MSKLDKIDFKNLPDTSTPLNAENMNKLQSNTEKAVSDESILNSIFEEVK